MKNIYISNADLNRDKRFTFLTEDVFVGGTTFRVQNLLGFESLSTSSGQIVLLGEIGSERTDILRTSIATSPSSSYKEITLRDPLVFDHPQDTKTYIVDWNRAEVQWSATATGTKSTLFAYPTSIQPDLPETIVVDTAKTTGFYFIRFNETVGNTNSDWSDPVPYGGFDDNMVASIKKRALDEVDEVIDGKIITNEYLNQCLWTARREYHKAPGKRPFRRKYNIAIGTALTGSYRIDLPTDVEKPYGAENVYGVRIGTQANMAFYDKKSWDFDYRGIGHGTLVTAYTVGNQDLYCDDIRNFDDSGSVSVEGTTIGYSARGISGGTLRISSNGSWSCSAGSDVWQRAAYGLPTNFTVFATPQGSAYIYFNRPIDTAYVNQDIFADYYTSLPGYDSDYDTLDEPDYDMFVSYLKYKIKERKSRGNISVTHNKNGQVFIADSDFQEWLTRKGNALATEFLSTDLRIRPDVPNDSELGGYPYV